MWHCLQSPATAAEIDQYDLHAERTAVNLQEWAVGLLLWAHAGTDRRTPYCFTDHAPHTTWAVPRRDLQTISRWLTIQVMEWMSFLSINQQCKSTQRKQLKAATGVDRHLLPTGPTAANSPHGQCQEETYNPFYGDWPYRSPFSALTLLVGQQEGHRACKKRVVGYWHGYLSGARCRLAYGPADAIATHCLLLQ